jgi:hypothetical protein
LSSAPVTSSTPSASYSSAPAPSPAATTSSPSPAPSSTFSTGAAPGAAPSPAPTVAGRASQPDPLTARIAQLEKNAKDANAPAGLQDRLSQLSQVRPPQLPNDAAPSATINIRPHED